MQFPQTPEALSPGWLSSVLQTDVAAIDWAQIGATQGFSGGTLVRMALHYREQQSDAPPSLVAKFAPSDPVRRAAFAAANAREVAIYTRSTDCPPPPAPRCYFASADAKTGASLLVLEDLNTASPFDFQTGASARQAASILRALAGVHAAHWSKDRPADLPAPDPLTRFDAAQAWAEYPRALTKLLPGHTLPDPFVALCERVCLGYRPPPGPQTLTHGDLQIDNIRLASDGTPRLLDWQLSGWGHGACDLAYFLASSLAPATRRCAASDLIATYHDALLQGGVTGYTLRSCHADIRLGIASKVLTTVVATTQLDNSSPSKIAWRATDLARLCAFCEDNAITARDFEAD